MARYPKDIWDPEKDGNKKEQRSFLRYAIIATALFFLFLLLKKDSVITWVQAGFTLRRQERQIEQLQQENAEMDRKMLMLEEMLAASKPALYTDEALRLAGLLGKWDAQDEDFPAE